MEPAGLTNGLMSAEASTNQPGAAERGDKAGVTHQPRRARIANNKRNLTIDNAKRMVRYVGDSNSRLTEAASLD